MRDIRRTLAPGISAGSTHVSRCIIEAAKALKKVSLAAHVMGLR